MSLLSFLTRDPGRFKCLIFLVGVFYSDSSLSVSPPFLRSPYYRIRFTLFIKVLDGVGHVLQNPVAEPRRKPPSPAFDTLQSRLGTQVPTRTPLSPTIQYSSHTHSYSTPSFPSFFDSFTEFDWRGFPQPRYSWTRGTPLVRNETPRDHRLLFWGGRG